MMTGVCVFVVTHHITHIILYDLLLWEKKMTRIHDRTTVGQVGVVFVFVLFSTLAYEPRPL